MKPAFLVIDKPEGITSHDVVAMVRAVLGLQKVGHTGTLDPFATGVLPLALGPATRLIQYLDEDLKVYDATIQLGQATDTGDLTGAVVREQPIPALDQAQVLAVLEGFKGVRPQVPPAYSAVKVAGRPLYKYARAGEEVKVQARPVRIDGIELISLDSPRLRVRITCGRGTYARVLADEIAQALGTSGHLVALRRDRSGPFLDSMALDLPTLARLAAEREDWQAVLRPTRGAERVPWRPRSLVQADLAPWLIPTATALGHLPALALSAGQRDLLRRAGQAPATPPGLAAEAAWVGVDGDEVLAVFQAQASGAARVLCSVHGG